MLAQRSTAILDAIDIDSDACLQARENIAKSPFANRIQVYQTSLSEYMPDENIKYDLIVSNPPYFIDSLKCPDTKRNDFDLVSRNAGPFFLLGEQIIHPTQVSTTVDYGVYLQFLARRGSSEVPLCAATPQNVEITGLAPADIIGIHTYCRDDVLEIIDARYLTRLPKPEKSENPPPSAE